MPVSDDNYDLGGKWLPLLPVDMRDHYAKLLVFFSAVEICMLKVVVEGENYERFHLNTDFHLH